MNLNKDEWDNLVIKYNGEFLQSWGWGVFQEALGRKIVRIHMADLGLAQIIISKLPFSQSYAYIPRGPVFRGNNEKELVLKRELVLKIEEAVAAETIFLLIEPTEVLSPGLLAPAEKKSKQPLKTLLIDLTLGDLELLASFSSKTRYNIGLAQRKDLKFEPFQEVIPFYQLLEKTAWHQNFKIYPRAYFECLYKILGAGGGQVEILGLTYQEKLLAVGLFFKFGSTVTYLHGASDYHYRSFMAPHLLHWQALNHFKKNGFRQYDFWGISEEYWPGLTRFKRGFGGVTKEYPGAAIKIFRTGWYHLYTLAKKWV